MFKNMTWSGVVMGIFLFCFIVPVSAQSDSADAIAVRVVPNPNHYSISRWYESQGFSGSPQSLLVDGYEAIRDGRTVYVNAANLAGGNIYTNIYLISYNQNPAAATVDILGQIVSHWKFNSNLGTDQTSYCSVSSLSCSSDNDCEANQYCATSTIASSSCLLRETKVCKVDTDCPTGLFCDSVKAKVTRDINRVGKIEQLKEALAKFKTTNKKYPVLLSGTYLAGHSLSLWPSWSQILLPSLVVDQEFFDPINRLGACPGFDSKTCWNTETKQFYSVPTGNVIKLPAGSYAFSYSTDPNGSEYNLCAVLETRALNLRFAPNDPVDSSCTVEGITAGGSATNTAPRIVDHYLVGEAGKEFNGFIKAVDQEDNPMTWTFSASSWSGDTLVLKDTSNSGQKKVYSTKAGNPGEYPVSLTITDGDKSISTTTKIKIIASSPSIEADNAEYILDQTAPLTYNFSFFSNNLAKPESAYSLTKISGPSDILASISKKITTVGSNKYRVDYSGLISTSSGFRLSQDTSYIYKITVTDKYGKNPSSKEFLLRVIVEQPQLGFNCLNSVRRGKAYSCLLGSKIQGNHNITYTVSNQPDGFQIVGQDSTSSPLIYLQGTSTAVITNNPVIKQVTVRAVNEYGASSTKEFLIRVNNYCGDGKKQTPNTEGRGGLYNDGYEDCDGLDGTTLDVKSSSVTQQYSCATGPKDTTPDPIPTGNYCVFKSPANGGGYCGDTICEAKVVDENGNITYLENATNCSEDCQEKEKCTPNCTAADGTNKTCGSDGCGGNCGSCASGQVCNANDKCEVNTSCVANCTNKQCGSDGCGGSCGNCTGFNICSNGTCVNSHCDKDNICEKNNGENCANCPVDCLCSDLDMTCNYTLMDCVSRFQCKADCGDKICGYTNGCGGSCGSCATGQICYKDGTECCTPSCKLADGTANECGDNGCGQPCGDCSLKVPLNVQRCVRQSKYFNDPGASRVRCCLPSDCINSDGSARECGGDGCGGLCGVGVCPTGQICNNKIGKCEKDLYCGDGTCNNNEDCGNCPKDCKCQDEYACNTTLMEPVCQKSCTCSGRECGLNECGESCGTCPAGETCQSNQCFGGGVCSHRLKCIDKECGPDGCDRGETCGTCPTGETCNSSGKCIKVIIDGDVVGENL